ncbi:hypothetical protein EKK58_08340 [Candidatus Dependentiae bacterium]|jgi:hypothetical protein|nr:MAG: hypothetical protein EKK58_08340 [Candidatus Dependentiae bacterium]
METPFDTKALVEKLKAQGLPLAEEAVELVVKETFAWIKESATIHPNAIVKAAVPLALQVIEPLAYKEIDKIDGKEG